MIERFFQKFEGRMRVVAELRIFLGGTAAITKWICRYYERRPHQELGFLLPEECQLKK